MANNNKIEDKNQISFYNQNIAPRLKAIKSICALSIAYILLRTVPAFVSTYPLTDRRYQEERFIKGALLAISVGAFFAILTQPSLDKFLYTAILLLAIAFPLLAASIHAEFYLHSLSPTTTPPKVIEYMGQIGGLSTIVAVGFLFWHLSYLAGLVFFILCVIVSLICSVVAFIFTFRGGIASLASELPPGSQEEVEKVIKLFNEAPIPEFLRNKEQQKKAGQVLILVMKALIKQLYQKQPQPPRENLDSQNLK